MRGVDRPHADHPADTPSTNTQLLSGLILRPPHDSRVSTGRSALVSPAPEALKCALRVATSAVVRAFPTFAGPYADNETTPWIQPISIATNAKPPKTLT